MATKNSIGSNKPVETTFGGTQDATLTQFAPLKGNGTGAIGDFGVGTNGQILIASSSGAPIWANITAGTDVTITNAANSIDIKASGAGSGTFTAPTPWTPVLNFTTSSSGIIYSVQQGFYILLGKALFFSYFIELSSIGTSSGNAFISGLPGTIVGTDEFGCAFIIYNSSSFSSNTATIGIIRTSTNTINLCTNNVITNNPLLTDTNFTNTSILYGNGLYFIT